MPATTTKTSSKVSGPTPVLKGFTEYEFNFSDTQNPDHQVVGGEVPDADTEFAAQTLQDSIQTRCTQLGVNFPAALALSVTPSSNIVVSGDFDATVMVWPPR
jgi:hypothetical protein